MSGTHIRFTLEEEEEDDDNEVLSASDDDYTVLEKNLLKSGHKEQPSDTEDEVYGVGTNSNEELNDSDLAISDVEAHNENVDLPDARAWGRDRNRFYSTDYVDPDYGGFQGRDAALAELEEEEAKNLQKQLTQELDDGDFIFDGFAKKEIDAEKVKEEVIQVDLSKLSRRQKLEILQKESPEFFGLVEDFKTRMGIARNLLFPIIQLTTEEEMLPHSNAIDFVKMQYQLILNYCININVYLLLKSAGTSLEHHPVTKRLYQYRKLIAQFDATFEELIKPQIEILLQEKSGFEFSTTHEQTKRTLKVLEKLAQKRGDGEVEDVDLKGSAKKRTFDGQPEVESDLVDVDTENETNEIENIKGERYITDQKRGITYQIAKNKGLTPHRKKEQRNPRVKHRNKFRKAKIRRKGAVREVKREIARYGGEISGIKASVSKSIKIK